MKSALDELPKRFRPNVKVEYGHVGMRVKKYADLRPALNKAFSMKRKLVFIDVLVDPNEHVYPMLVAPNGSMKDMWLSKSDKV